MFISVVIPIFNEENNLNELFERLDLVLKETGHSYEIVFIHDCGTDRSLEIIKQICSINEEVKYLEFSRNFGHQIAISAGIDYASGDAIVIMDGDLQDPPELIPNLLNKFLEGNEVVYAKRKKRKGVNIFKKFSYFIFYRVLNSLSSIKIPLDTGDFRIIDRKVADVLKNMTEQDKFLRGQIAWMGFNQSFVEYERDKRNSGEPGYSITKLLKLAFDGIFSFSNVPLRIATLLGVITALFSFFLILWVVMQKFLIPNYEIQGWYSLMVSVLFLGGVQLLSIGIIGEYISRMNTNTKQRPLYILKDKKL